MLYSLQSAHPILGPSARLSSALLLIVAGGSCCPTEASSATLARPANEPAGVVAAHDPADAHDDFRVDSDLPEYDAPDFSDDADPPDEESTWVRK